MARTIASHLFAGLAMCTLAVSPNAWGQTTEGTAAKKGYLIVELKVTDPDTYKQYAAQVPATLQPFDGHFLVRAGKSVPIEGGPPDGVPVVLEFPSLKKALQWEQSPAYQAIVDLRHQSARTRIYAVEGVTP